jgi:CMP-N,N'-diacetyllegionaminic acid synthase
LMLNSGADTVVSVVAVPHNFNPVSVMRMDESGYLVPFLSGEMILRRQEKPRVYARNGPAILAVKRAVMETGKLYGERTLPYEMDHTASIDIDDLEDLEMAEFWIQYQEAQRRVNTQTRGGQDG